MFSSLNKYRIPLRCSGSKCSTKIVSNLCVMTVSPPDTEKKPIGNIACAIVVTIFCSAVEITCVSRLGEGSCSAMVPSVVSATEPTMKFLRDGFLWLFIGIKYAPLQRRALVARGSFSYDFAL